MEPKYLSFRRWLYTPCSSSEKVIGSLGFTKTVTGVRQAPMYVVNSDHISPSEFLKKLSLRQQKLPNPVHDPHRKKKIKPPNSSNGLIPSSLTPLFAVTWNIKEIAPKVKGIKKNSEDKNPKRPKKIPEIWMGETHPFSWGPELHTPKIGTFPTLCWKKWPMEFPTWMEKFRARWWFQPIWKILVKLDHFPR